MARVPNVQHWTCLGCGAACERLAVRGQRPKWCDGCRANGARERSCVTCGKVGIRSDSDYCSPSCKPEAIRANGRLTRARIRAGLLARGTRGTKVWKAGPCVVCRTAVIFPSASHTTCSSQCAAALVERRRKGRQKIRRNVIFERDAYTCWLCGEACDPDLRVPASLAPTVDHVLPRSLGGSDDPTNLRCAHFLCNSKRGAKPVAA